MLGMDGKALKKAEHRASSIELTGRRDGEGPETLEESSVAVLSDEALSLQGEGGDTLRLSLGKMILTRGGRGRESLGQVEAVRVPEAQQMVTLIGWLRQLGCGLWGLAKWQMPSPEGASVLPRRVGRVGRKGRGRTQR